MRPLLVLAAATLSIAAVAGGAIAQPPTFDQVIESLKSPKPDERMEALKLLAAAPYPQAEVPVARLLTDPVATVRLAAIATEMNCFLGEPLASRARVAFVIEVRNRVGAQAAFDQGLLALMPQPLPDEVFRGLLGAVSDPDPRVVREAIYGLGVVSPLLAGSTRAASLTALGQRLAPALRNADPTLREAALQVLHRAFEVYPVDSPTVDDALGDAVITEMNDADPGVRAAAVQALGAMQNARALQALTDRFQYFKARGDRQAAPTLAALARVAHASARPLFEQLVSDPDPAIRAAAIDGLGRLSDAASISALVDRLKGERDAHVLLALNFAMARAGGRVPLDTFVAILSNQALATEARQDLLELTATGHTMPDDWTAALRTQDLGTRLELARLVALAGDASLVPVLKPLLNDGDPRIAETARRGMARLQLVPARSLTRR
ncbi:MAG TPA: HEAT repeat domain-containing protein [Vicinamibacterales bacterium]|jgi:HEAT repeat protein